MAELSVEQKSVAEKLFRNFLIVLILAFAAEVALRAFPAWLAGSVERRWLEWLLVSLIGVCAYLIWNVAIWYQRPEKANFVRYRPWYRATAARGPVLTLIILIALTNINFGVELPAAQPAVTEEAGQTTGGALETDVEAATAPAAGQTFEFGINFGQASENVLLVAAFLLGLYSRLAKEIIGRIAQFIFRSAFDEAYGKELAASEDDQEKSGSSVETPRRGV